jgi:predicted phosphodiesterase
MRSVIFSDLHGNLPALVKLREKFPDCDSWISLGDNVNYGPWSNECVIFIKEELSCKSLLGNHEEYFLTGIYPGKNIIAKEFFKFCYPFFKEKEIIKKYLDSFQLGNFFLSHTINGKYIFSDTDISITENHFLGHSHQQYTRKLGKHVMVNPGSLGQDRQYINRANYAVYDHDTDSFELNSFTYNVDTVISEMKSKKYPQICIDYYQQKGRLS